MIQNALLAQVGHVQQFLSDKFPCRLHAAVKIDGSKQCLHHVSQNRLSFPFTGSLCASAQFHIFADPEPHRNAVQALFTDQFCAQTGHTAFRHSRFMLIKKFRCQKSEHGIPEKFQTLIAVTVMFIGIGRVRQSRLQEFRVSEMIPDFIFKPAHSLFSALIFI